MVSKEPNHLLTGQANSKSTLADKLPGTMTVRSVLLNRDSPDIESRLKRRRNRTHQVRFKDLEDGSSSSGNGATAEAKSHQRPAADRDSPHPLRKHGGATPKGWTERDGPGTEALPGQTSVVGAVRGDMAGTIEVVAAFLARAPPHPLTPGPTRRCWAPPQANSLTLPMTRKPSTSTSTAIQTSPCQKKPQPVSSTYPRCHSLGDSVGVDGDDEQDSQDEYLAHNHVLSPGSRNEISPPGPAERTVVERRPRGSRTDDKAAASVVKSSRHSCPPSVLHRTEPCYSSSVSCRDGFKRQGSTTPSLVRRRKRLNRAVSDPGKEVSYCTTPTQTESPSPSPPPSNTQLCTTQVQTESPCPSPPPNEKQCTTQSQTESPCPSPPPNEKHCTTQSQTESLCPSPPPNEKHCTTQSQTESLCPSPPLIEKHYATQIQINNPSPFPPPSAKQSNTQIQTESPSPSPSSYQPCTTQTQTDSPRASPPLSICPSSAQIQSETTSPTLNQDPHTTQINTVPYCASPPPTTAPTPTPQHCVVSPCPAPARPACTTPTPPAAPSSAASCPTSAPAITQHSIPYYTVLSPPQTPATATDSSGPATATTQRPAKTCATPMSNKCTTLSCPSTTPTATPSITPNGPTLAPATSPNANIAFPPPANASNTAPPTNVTPCTFVTQTALSCTSISYYTTTHPNGHTGHPSTTPPPYATLIQTVSHCNIPCQALQNISSASPGVAPYSSPVPKLKSCTSPPPLVKTYASTLSNMQSCATPTKTVPLYSSTFRAAPPYTPPSQAPYNTQDKRGVRLPPPPPPPPPYTPRKEGGVTPGPACRPPALRADGKASEKGKDGEREKKENAAGTESPRLCERASSLKRRAPTPPVAVMKGGQQSSSFPAKVCSKPSCLSSAQAQLGALHKMLCSGASARPNTPNSQLPLPSSQQGCSGSGERSTAGPLTATQADTLRQVQEILGGLVSGARCKLDPSRVTEKLLSPNGPLHDIRSLQTQLHSLEGVLETSQNTIKVLLDVIQDLEKKEAERDGRHSYRTGQDIENCGTCRDCACIIYSVEHDFRLQEGQVVRTWKVGDPPEESPQSATPQPTTPHRQESPPPGQPPATAATKKNRKKCFWFL